MLTEEQKQEIFNKRSSGMRGAALARSYGVSQGRISQIYHQKMRESITTAGVPHGKTETAASDDE